MNQSPRSRARELVLMSLYASEHGELEAQHAFDSISSDEDIEPRHLEFARKLLVAVIAGAEAADKHIARLADNWNLERFAALDRSILRMAIVELETFPDTPVKVVLNEAIELAKKFSTIESSKFVNGILDNFVKSKNSGLPPQ